ncbi:hypothetical protein BCR43DRAFT_527008 [Syncephalastrum racemosum]|uniref:Reelin domain-containing protein n=1 Tax=Syncephalastrum racemosum TaxID=13706 RepID=A0A1X2H509_SYNRA|nr:hypothetical protein BCR43DRAFT_527008 [Syncephalastrum racemosum]
MRNVIVYCVTLLLAVVATMAAAADDSNGDSNSPQVIYPTPNTVLYAGTQGRFEYNPEGFTPNDTVSLFFDEDRSTSLGYGQASQGNFTFIVPAKALTLAGHNASHLIAVFRRNFYLWKVADVPVRVDLPPANVTQLPETPVDGSAGLTAQGQPSSLEEQNVPH